jgi:cyclopropane-fatty-acyl-phospholipid synthase
MKRNEPNWLGLPDGGGLSSSETQGVAEASVSGSDRWLAQRLIAAIGKPPFSLTLWNGEAVYTPESSPVGNIILRDRRALLGLIFSPYFYFGDAYSTGRIEVDGDLVECLKGAYEAVETRMPPGSIRREIRNWLHRPRGTGLTSARRNIHHHYDLGNEFYRLWLDKRLVYTCAYYDPPEATLEQAQVAKMHHVCRKLELKPGQEVVEAGCGWGTLALHMARHYGVKVWAFNISREQIRYAREQARIHGLDDRVEFIEDDYRNISGQCDAFVSVGMLEHVGPDNYETLGAVIGRALKVGGRGLIHSIGRNRPEPLNPWIERRIFPGGRPPSLSEMTGVFEPYNFSILDVENLRLHYERTCHDWLERFEQASDQVEQMYDSTFVRAWRLYLAGSVAAFSTGSLQLFQVVFAHAKDNSVPLTRRHVYADS